MNQLKFLEDQNVSSRIDRSGEKVSGDLSSGRGGGTQDCGA